MRKTVTVSVSLLVIGIGVWASPAALAAPTAFQCEVPMQSVGTAGIRIPAPLPTRGELLIKFQRVAGEPTQATISFSEVKQAKALLDRIAQAINDEAAQRPPKMAAVRERGLDTVTTVSSGPVTGVALTEIFRVLVVYDPTEMQVAFQGPGSYALLCTTLAPLREVPNLTDVKMESRPKLLFVAFPERISSGQPATAGVAFTDREDDVTSVRIVYRSEDGSVSDVINATGLPTLPIPSPFGPGLKAVRLALTIECRRHSIAFQGTAYASDNAGHEAEPITFNFICEP